MPIGIEAFAQAQSELSFEFVLSPPRAQLSCRRHPRLPVASMSVVRILPTSRLVGR